MRKFVAALAVAGLLTAASPVTAAHAWEPGDASITNIGGPSFLVCKDWGKTTCLTSSPRGTLYSNQNSRTKFGWADTDGYFLPAKCSSRDGGNGPRWVKVGGLLGGVRAIGLKCWY